MKILTTVVSTDREEYNDQLVQAGRQKDKQADNVWNFGMVYRVPESLNCFFFFIDLLLLNIKMTFRIFYMLFTVQYV